MVGAQGVPSYSTFRRKQQELHSIKQLKYDIDGKTPFMSGIRDIGANDWLSPIVSPLFAFIPKSTLPPYQIYGTRLKFIRLKDYRGRRCGKTVIETVIVLTKHARVKILSYGFQDAGSAGTGWEQLES